LKDKISLNSDFYEQCKIIEIKVTITKFFWDKISLKINKFYFK